MNIQIYSGKKNFDVQKAERYFKERGIKFQSVDLAKHPLSPRELDAIAQAVGLENLIDRDNKLYAGSLLRYSGSDSAKKEQLLADNRLMKTPIVRNGKKATVGFAPETWDSWND